jgi:hypothetical protein
MLLAVSHTKMPILKMERIILGQTFIKGEYTVMSKTEFLSLLKFFKNDGIEIKKIGSIRRSDNGSIFLSQLFLVH